MNIFETLIKTLTHNSLTIAVAESLTGGMLASEMVSVPGASKAFAGGVVTYCDAAKRSMTGVSGETLERFGAISAQAAEQMAEGAAKAFETDIGISTTGNAGPDADEKKPVGLVYIGFYKDGTAGSIEFSFSGNRDEIRKAAAEKAAEICVKLIDSVGEISCL